jgi:hypothetical protein
MDGIGAYWEVRGQGYIRKRPWQNLMLRARATPPAVEQHGAERQGGRVQARNEGSPSLPNGMNGGEQTTKPESVARMSGTR